LIFGRIFTAVAADGERRDFFGVRSATSVNARDGDHDCFIAARAAARCTVRTAGSREVRHICPLEAGFIE